MKFKIKIQHEVAIQNRNGDVSYLSKERKKGERVRERDELEVVVVFAYVFELALLLGLNSTCQL